MIETNGAGVRKRRPIRTASFLVVATICLLMPTTPAAALNEAPDRSWGTNGPVHAVLVTKRRVYIGGDFGRVVAPGGRQVARRNLAAFHKKSGRLVRGWNPKARGGSVFELTRRKKRLFVGGNFNRINRRSRKGLAALKARRGGVVRGWRVQANFPVWELARRGTKLYVGGAFTKLRSGGTTLRRRHLARVSTKSGRVSRAWTPGTNGTVKALDVAPGGKRLYAGGNFTEPRRWIVAYKRRTGAIVRRWRGHRSLEDMSPCGLGCVIDIDSTSNLVYAGVGGVEGGNRLVALRAGSGDLAWQKRGNGDVHAVEVAGNRVYAGGHFGSIANRPRRRFATFRAVRGNILSDFSPSFNSSLGIWDIAGGNRRLWVVGNFTQVQNRERLRFARFSS
ncbi:MAG: hypothetical protein ACRDHO_05115 [Actinomycetota bacterium]